jgi:L-amino acid N-acyltransferase
MSVHRQRLTIRSATLDDLQAIMDIYNDAILHTTATFDVEAKTLEDRRAWFKEHDEKHPLIVAEMGGGVLGWGSLSEYGDRKAWEHTVENAVYVRPDAQGKGIGKAILAELVRLAEELGYHAVVAEIVGGNEASIRLHERQGFRVVGVLNEVGWKFDGWLDVVLLERFL